MRSLNVAYAHDLRMDASVPQRRALGDPSVYRRSVRRDGGPAGAPRQVKATRASPVAAAVAAAPASVAAAAPPDYVQLEQQVKQLSEQLRLLAGPQQRAALLEKTAKAPLGPLRRKEGRSFVLLPQFRTIEHPLKPGSRVQVASSAWLWVLDLLRAVGMPQERIDAWLEQSARIVQEDASYEVTAQTIEDFANLWPDESDQAQRIAFGRQRLIQDIIDATKPLNPFQPPNEQAAEAGLELPKCPPPKLDLTVGTQTFPDLLQNWTVPTVVEHGSSTKNRIFECRPEDENAWIPEQYREQLESLYNITPYRYTSDRDQLKRYQAYGRDRADYDPTGRRFVPITLEDGRTYRAYQMDLDLQRDCPSELRQRSLRDWCAVRESYPLLHLLLNLDAPFDEDLRVYRYEVPTEGKTLFRLVADAPLSVFRDLLVSTVQTSAQQKRQWPACENDFIDAVYLAMRKSGLGPNLPEKPSARDRGLLQTLYRLGRRTGGGAQCAAEPRQFVMTPGGARRRRATDAPVSRLALWNELVAWDPTRSIEPPKVAATVRH